MKKIIIILISLFATSLAWSQDITLDEKELTTLFCKSWQMDSAMMDGKPMVQKEVKDLGFTFNKDFTFYLIEDGKATSVGLWKYFPDKKWIALALYEKVSLIITSIDEEKFIAVSPAQLEVKEGDKKMEVIFKAK